MESRSQYLPKLCRSQALAAHRSNMPAGLVTFQSLCAAVHLPSKRPPTCPPNKPATPAGERVGEQRDPVRIGGVTQAKVTAQAPRRSTNRLRPAYGRFGPALP